MFDSYDIDPYELGYYEYFEGIDSYDNPYHLFTTSWSDWRQGWHDACRAEENSYYDFW